MQVKVIAIEPFNGKHPGAIVETSEREARELVAKGLAKMAVPVQNKMALPVANKSSPTCPAGVAQRSFASPAGRVSPSTTVQPLPVGVKRGPGRPRKVVE